MGPVTSSWAMISFLLTILVLAGYFLGEKNFIFRIMTYSLVGLTSAIVLMVVVFQVIIPRLVWPLNSSNTLEAGSILVPILLGLLLFTKLSQRIGRLGNFSMALMTGVGAAVLIAGALSGTILPQIKAVLDHFALTPSPATGLPARVDLLDAIFILFGTAASLAYFQFSGKPRPEEAASRSRAVEFLAWFGKIFIAVALGALFAGVFLAALGALLERLGFVWNVLGTLQIQ